uniref:Uncharacterized protein LOC111116606 n=1 Tax=Crassostrea virginica TaxID=6565 RepID=A0A8B8C975_CRAVI|nr:uncharacterized protein LOC111116606 [Crassostrea virginica]
MFISVVLDTTLVSHSFMASKFEIPTSTSRTILSTESSTETDIQQTSGYQTNQNVTISFWTTEFDQTTRLPTKPTPISGQNMTIGSRGKSFIVLFMTDGASSTKNIYITSENGVQMNMSTSKHFDTFLKSQIDRVVKIPSNEHIINQLFLLIKVR